MAHEIRAVNKLQNTASRQVQQIRAESPSWKPTHHTQHEQVLQSRCLKSAGRDSVNLERSRTRIVRPILHLSPNSPGATLPQENFINQAD